MQDNIYQQINEQTDIVALVSKYVSLTKKGKNYMGLCPFHDENTPSFSVTPEKNLAYCFGCKKGGAPITFLSQIKNISNFEAAKELADILGIEFGQTKTIVDPNQHLYEIMKDAANFYQFALKNSESGLQAYKYLTNRKLDDTLVTHFEVGYAPDQIDGLYKMLRSKKHSVSDMMNLGLVKQNEDGIYYDVFRHRIIFPIKDDKGLIVGFSGRALSQHEKAKYINSTETPIFKKGHTLYHYFESMRPAVKQKHVVLHEGYFDVFASHKSGFEASVATMGTAVTTEQAKLLKRITNHVVVAYDGDNAGIDATLKVIPVLKRHHLDVSILNLPNKLDPDDFVLKHGKVKYQNLFTKRLDPYQFGYTYYQANKDFKVAADITRFKNEMKQLLLGSDPTVIDLYERRSFDELGIQLLINTSGSYLPTKDKKIYKEYPKRAERALDLLIIYLLKRRAYIDQIKDRILITEITNAEKRQLFKDIINYYDTNQIGDLDIQIFSQGYTKKEELLKTYLERSEYIKDMLIESDEHFENILKPIKDYQIQLEIDSLLKESETLEGDAQVACLKRIDLLRKQVRRK